MTAATVDQLRAEGAERIAQAAARLPAKVMSRRTGLPERRIRGIRQHQHQPGWPTLIVLARHCPNLRAWVLEQLGVSQAPVISAEDEAALVAALQAYAQRKQTGDHG